MLKLLFLSFDWLLRLGFSDYLSITSLLVAFFYPYLKDRSKRRIACDRPLLEKFLELTTQWEDCRFSDGMFIYGKLNERAVRLNDIPISNLNNNEIKKDIALSIHKLKIVMAESVTKVQLNPLKEEKNIDNNVFRLKSDLWLKDIELLHLTINQYLAKGA